MNGYDARLLAPNRKVIYLDVDGTLADWEGAAQKYLHLEDMSRKDFIKWASSKKGLSNTLPFEFWQNLPWLPNGEELYKFCTTHAATVICTSPGNSPESSGGKHAWLNKNIGNRNWMITGAKWAMAGKDAILIDDRPKNVDRFIKAGGSAFLYSDNQFAECKQWLLKTLN